MRELKFRGWWADPQIMVEFGLGQDYFKGCFSHVDNECYTCEIEFADSIMQYTGLLDKNGKEIYEGDVVKEIISFPSLYREELYEIKYEDSSFDCRCKGGGKYSIKYKELEVIGNIYENKELLD